MKGKGKRTIAQKTFTVIAEKHGEAAVKSPFPP